MSVFTRRAAASHGWTITSQDEAVDLVLASQYLPEGGITRSRPPVIGGNVAVGSDAPNVDWIAPGADTVSLRSRYRSLHQRDDLRPRRALLERLVAADPVLGRAPRVLFSWGEVRLAGYVSQLRITESGRWAVSGLPIEIAFELELTASTPIRVATADPGQGETLVLTLAAGETFELLGERYLGDPLRGELVRRINPSVATAEAAGVRVRVYEASHPAMRAAVRPLSPAFGALRDGSRPWLDVVEALAEARGTTDRGTPWRLLPEVLSGAVA